MFHVVSQNIIQLRIAFILGIVALALLVGIVYGKSINPKITGDSGLIEGVEVLDFQGNRVCEDPYWHKELQVISCE